MKGEALHQTWDKILYPPDQKIDLTFIEAFIHVFHEYGWMFDDLNYIRLVPADLLTYAYGLYRPDTKGIDIRLSRESVLDYIDTLVHELIHHVQHTTNALPIVTRDQCETQANNYAYLAVKQYKEKKGIPLWK